MMSVRVVMALGLLVGCMRICSEAHGIDSRAASVAFLNMTPKAGAKAGEVDVTVEWKMCTGAVTVEVGLYKTDCGQQKLVATMAKTNAGGLKADDTHSWTKTGLTTGVKLTSADANVYDGCGNVLATVSAKCNVTVP